VSESTDRADAKAQVRRHVAEVLARLGPERFRAAGLAVARHLASLPAVRQADTIMAFISLPKEIDTGPVIRWAWDQGKRVAIPRMEAAAGAAPRAAPRWRMVAVHLEAADVPAPAAHPALEGGTFGFLTALDAPAVPAGEIDVVLAPCQAVDRRGNRLGRGGGYYDQFLAQPEVRAVRIALAMAEQVLDAVPVGEADEPMDRIVTEGEVLRFNRAAAGPTVSTNPAGEE
jgi:5-formyltetrahydrofolate cyclo-ligase